MKIFLDSSVTLSANDLLQSAQNVCVTVIPHSSCSASWSRWMSITIWRRSATFVGPPEPHGQSRQRLCNSKSINHSCLPKNEFTARKWVWLHIYIYIYICKWLRMMLDKCRLIGCTLQVGCFKFKLKLEIYEKSSFQPKKTKKTILGLNFGLWTVIIILLFK